MSFSKNAIQYFDTSEYSAFFALKKAEWNEFTVRSIQVSSTPRFPEKYHIFCYLNEYHCKLDVVNIIANFDQSKLIVQFNQETNQPSLLTTDAINSALEINPPLIGSATSEWTDSKTLELIVSETFLADISFAHQNKHKINIIPRKESSFISDLNHQSHLPDSHIKIRFTEHGNYIFFLAHSETRTPLSQLHQLQVDLCGDTEIIGSPSYSLQPHSDSAFDLAENGDREGWEALPSTATKDALPLPPQLPPRVLLLPEEGRSKPPSLSFSLRGPVPLDGKHGLVIPSASLPPSAGGGGEGFNQEWGPGWSLSFWLYLTQEPTSQFRTLFYKGSPSPSSTTSRTPSAWFLPHQGRLSLKVTSSARTPPSWDDFSKAMRSENQDKGHREPTEGNFSSPSPPLVSMEDVGVETLKDIPSGRWVLMGFSFFNLSHSREERLLRLWKKKWMEEYLANESTSSLPSVGEEQGSERQVEVEEEQEPNVEEKEEKEEKEEVPLVTSPTHRVTNLPILSPTLSPTLTRTPPSTYPSSNSFPATPSSSLPGTLPPRPPYSRSRSSHPRPKNNPNFMMTVFVDGKVDINVQYPMFIHGNSYPLSMFADPLLSYPSNLGFASDIGVWDRPLSETEMKELYLRGHRPQALDHWEREIGRVYERNPSSGLKERVEGMGGERDVEREIYGGNLNPSDPNLSEKGKNTKTISPPLSTFSTSPIEYLSHLVGKSDSVSALPSPTSSSTHSVPKRIGRRSLLRLKVMGFDALPATPPPLYTSFPPPPFDSPLSPTFRPDQVLFMDDEEVREGMGGGEGMGVGASQSQILLPLSAQLLERAKTEFRDCLDLETPSQSDPFNQTTPPSPLSFFGPGSRLDLLSLSSSLGNSEALLRWGLGLGWGSEEPNYRCGRGRKSPDPRWKDRVLDLLSSLYHSIASSFSSDPYPSDPPSPSAPSTSVPSLLSKTFTPTSTPIYLTLHNWEGEGGFSAQYWRLRLSLWKLDVSVMQRVNLRRRLIHEQMSGDTEGRALMERIKRLERVLRRDLAHQRQLKEAEVAGDKGGEGESKIPNVIQDLIPLLPPISSHLISQLPLIRSQMALVVALDRGQAESLPFLSSGLLNGLAWEAGRELWADLWGDGEGVGEWLESQSTGLQSSSSSDFNEVEEGEDLNEFLPPLSLLSLLHVPWPDSFYPSTLSLPPLPFQPSDPSPTKNSEELEIWSGGLPALWHQLRRIVEQGRASCRGDQTSSLEGERESFSHPTNGNDNTISTGKERDNDSSRHTQMLALPPPSTSSHCFLPNSSPSQYHHSYTHTSINFDPISLASLSLHYLGSLLSVPHSQFILSAKFHRGTRIEGLVEGSMLGKRTEGVGAGVGVGMGVLGDVETALFYASLAAEVSSVEFHRVGFQPIVEADRLNERSEGKVEQGNKGQDDELILNQQVRAAEGDSDAMVAMGDLLYYGGRGMGRDHPAALDYFQQAAQAGNPSGMCGAAGMFLKGEGTEKNATRAEELYSEAASLGSIRALNGLGYMYFYGQGGVPKNESKALAYFLEAANMGDASDSDSQFNAGFCLLNGLGISPPDPTRAAHYFTVAARKFGHFDAIMSLGRMYMEGRGVVRSASEALLYLFSAAQIGPWAGWIRRGFDGYLDGEEERKDRGSFSAQMHGLFSSPDSQYGPIPSLGWNESMADQHRPFLRELRKLDFPSLPEAGHLRALSCYLLAAEGGFEVASSNAAFILRRRILPLVIPPPSSVNSSLGWLAASPLTFANSSLQSVLQLQGKFLRRFSPSTFAFLAPLLPQSFSLQDSEVPPQCPPHGLSVPTEGQQELLNRISLQHLQAQSFYASLELRTLGASLSLGSTESSLHIAIRFFQGLRGLRPHSTPPFSIHPQLSEEEEEEFFQASLLSARFWFSKASSSGLLLASLYLGAMDHFGIGKKRNLLRAVRHYDKALGLASPAPSTSVPLRKDDSQGGSFAQAIWSMLFDEPSPSDRANSDNDEMSLTQIRTWTKWMRWVAQHRLHSNTHNPRNGKQFPSLSEWCYDQMEKILSHWWSPY